MKPPRVVGEMVADHDRQQREHGRTRDDVVRRDSHPRRKERYTPEYQAWLDRQAKKGRNP